MAKFSGHGSYAVFHDTVNNDYYLIDNVTNSTNFEPKMQEYTDSGSLGWSRGLSGVNVAQADMTCNDDDESAIDISGLQLSTLGTLYVRRGTPEVFDVITDTRWAGVAREANNMEGGVPQLRLKFMHGVGSPGVAKASLPAPLKAYLIGLTPARITA